MIKTSRDAQALKLHVHNGRVWFLDRDLEYARCSHLELDEYLDSQPFGAGRCVRVVGGPSNVELILALYDLKKQGTIEKLEVCTPLVCRAARHRRKPEAVLMAMRRLRRAASLGGFHEVTELDYRTYALVNAVYEHADRRIPLGKETLQKLYEHPAWRPLSFIQSLNQVAVAGLLATIIDPRWFVDDYNPDKAGKLYEWLGLSPRTQAGVSGSRSPGRYHRRCRLVLNCWKNASLEPEIRARFTLVPPIPVEDSAIPGYAPYDFVWRRWAEKLKLRPDSNASGELIMADLRASQRLVAFLRLTWLSEIYREAPGMPEKGAPLFRSTDFFKHPEEIEAYQLHDYNS